MSDAPFESSADGEKIPSDADWENRTLCSDESCIGVIGPDGRCKECGKPYKKPPAPENKEPQTSKNKEPQIPETQTVRAASGTGDDIDRNEQRTDSDDWESRTLCSDESCIGVIGPDGRCKECGKVYQG
jgi:hypothetical protein